MFKYGMKFVIDTDLPNVQKYHAARGYNIDCPLCGAKRKMNIDEEKGVFSCPICCMEKGNGFLKLHMLLRHFNSTAEAKKDLDARFESLSQSEKKLVFTESTTAVSVSSVTENRQAARIEFRDRIYREWLKQMPLSKSDRNELHSEKRGWLSDEYIAKKMYATYSEGKVKHSDISYTYPEFAWVTVTNDRLPWVKMRKRGKSPIPGFNITKAGRLISQREKDCMLIPVIDRYGRISFLQQKYPKLPDTASPEQKARFKKYGRYGSYGASGCSTSGLESIHYTGFDFSQNQKGITPKTVCLTEGILKSDIASYLSDRPFIALVGVSVYSQLDQELQFLKSGGTKMIVVCVDMDYLSNRNVANAMNTIIQKIKNAGLIASLCTWDNRWKGIDDVLIAKKKGYNIGFQYTFY